MSRIRIISIFLPLGSIFWSEPESGSGFLTLKNLHALYHLLLDPDALHNKKIYGSGSLVTFWYPDPYSGRSLSLDPESINPLIHLT